MATSATPPPDMPTSSPPPPQAHFTTVRTSYALDFTWDVRNHVPPYQDKYGSINRRATDDEDTDVAIQKVYNRINMMTFLLEGIPFNVFLNEPILTWIDHAIYKVADQGRWPGRVAPPSRDPITNPLPDQEAYRRASRRTNHVSDVQFHDFPNDNTNGHDSPLRMLIFRKLTDAKNAADGSVRLRRFWEVKLADLDAAHKNVFAALKLLQKPPTDPADPDHNHQHGHRFCLPFVTVQDLNDPKKLVPRHIMDAFVALMEGVTHYDVYTKSVKYFPRIHAGVELGKRYGIFEAPYHPDPLNATDEEIKGGGGANNRICDPGLSTCITKQNYSCTTDSNGLCTAG